MTKTLGADQLLFQMLKGGVDKHVRDALGASIAGSIRRGTKDLPPLGALSPDEESAVSDLRARGFVPTVPLFSDAQIDDILAYFEPQPTIFYQTSAVAADAVVRPFNERPAGYRFCEWDQDIISGCPAFAAAAHAPSLLRIAEAYLQAPPTITILTAWWSFPSNEALGGMQNFHHDRDDFRCLKLFTYLTPVTEQTGPHEYVDRTHTAQSVARVRPWASQVEFTKFLQWMEVHRKKEEDVRAYFPAELIRTITGPRGSTFLEDTRGLHRGVPPISGPRLAFEICYSLSPKFNATYRPIARPDSCPRDSRATYVTRLFYGDMA